MSFLRKHSYGFKARCWICWLIEILKLGSTAMKTLGKGVQNGAGYMPNTLLILFVVGFAMLFAGMAAYSVVNKIVPPEAALWETLRCATGNERPTDLVCLEKRARDEERRNRGAQARLEEIATIEKRFNVVNLFAKDRKNGFEVTTGVEYRDLTTKPRWTKAWCYTRSERGDAQIIVELGEATPSGGIKPEELTIAERNALGRTSAESLRTLCKWPNGSV